VENMWVFANSPVITPTVMYTLRKAVWGLSYRVSSLSHTQLWQGCRQKFVFLIQL